MKQGDISVRRELEVVSVHEIMKVSLQDFVAEDSESPIHSLEEFSGVRSLSPSSLSVTSLSDPLAQFQSIEKPFVNTRPHRCHITPKAKFRDLAGNDSNIIAGSFTTF